MDAREAERLVKLHGGKTQAARAIGMPLTTFKARLKGAKDSRAPAVSETESLVEFPHLPSSELPADQLIDQACKRFAGHMAAKEARHWMEIKIKSNQPIGVAFVGDPHVDNNGCNWPLLRRDISVMRDTPGMFAVNIGDVTDNWAGRLIRLYADQEMSKKQAWKLAKYFLRDAGVKWLCHLLGNHDQWADGPYLIKAGAAPVVPVEDWGSKFQLVFPNGARVKIHAAHDFPGHSMWNGQHGAQKMSMLGEQADIYACGHKHFWSVNHGENAQRDFVYHLIRSRGYKVIDQYAENLGYSSQRYGATITAIIDPVANGINKIRCFADVEESAEYLTWKRSRA